MFFVLGGEKMDKLNESRKQIEQIDKEMAKLFCQRLDAAKEIADYKKERALPVYDALRESELIKANLSYVEKGEHAEFYELFIKDVMKNSRLYQDRIINGLKVVYCGEKGAFAHIASQKAFPNANYYACLDFETAYKGVENGEYDCAVLPLENSFAGEVGVVSDLMFSGSLYINRVVEVGVVHNLLGVKGAKMSDIKTVVSHPQALEQCADFIKQKNLKTVEYSNTALAAKFVSEKNDPTICAIASSETAEEYGLEILEGGINTSNSNTTRFGVFTRVSNLPNPSSKNENEHFILMFTTKNEAGALAQALNIIGAHNFNMRSLRSRPLKDLLWNYYFYVELEGNVASRDGKEMLQELSAICARLKLVGTYTK